MALLWKFPRNPWLWIAAPFQILHQAEHTFLFFEHVLWGYPQGGPGLLAFSPAAVGNPQLNGALGSLLNRPDLHWIYNTLYTIPFVIALVWQLKRTYDEALDEAFPEAPKSELVRPRPSNARRSSTSPARPSSRLAIRPSGCTSSPRARPTSIDEIDGNEVVIGTLGHGKVFGEHGLAVPGAVHDKTIGPGRSCPSWPWTRRHSTIWTGVPRIPGWPGDTTPRPGPER